MELREGYKNTEVGVIPEDWELKEFGDFLKVIGGGAFKSRDSSQTGVKWLKIANVDINKTNWDDESFLPIELIKDNENFLLKEGDYVLALTRPILDRKLKIAKLNLQDVPALLNQRVGKIEVESQTNIDYTYYLFQKFETISGLLQSMAGTDPPNLSNKGIYGIKCGVPPTKAEQTAIATALSDADALINSLEKLIAKKRNIKQGAMQYLLKPNPDSNREGWEVKKLGDFLDYEQPTEYLVTDTEYNDNNQIPVLTAGKTFILGYTNEEHGIFKNLPVIIFDDFTTAIKYVDFPFKAKSSAMKMLIPINEEVNLRFIYEIMLQIKYQVADHKRHWIGEYSKIEIKVPSTPEEQTRIATILSDMDAEIQALETKLEKYRKIKLGMMQNLLTGKIRLI